MLKPASIYKEQLLAKFSQYLYTDDYFWYAGYGVCNELPKIELADEHYQYVILDGDEVAGYFAYRIQSSVDTVCNFGLFSFDRGNPIIGIDIFKKLEELVKEHHRVEWRMIGGNPIKRSYDRFCQKHGGNCVVLHSVTKDIHGEWHDEYVYEIVREDGMK